MGNDRHHPRRHVLPRQGCEVVAGGGGNIRGRHLPARSKGWPRGRCSEQEIVVGMYGRVRSWPLYLGLIARCWFQRGHRAYHRL